MPRTAFSTSALNAATPGLSKLAAAIAGGGGAYQQGMNNEIQLQSRLAQALSAQQLNQAKEDEIRDQAARGTPEAVLRNVMTGFGIPLNDTNAVTQYMESGELGGRFAKPADDVGPVLPQPAWAKNLGRVGQAVMATQNALAVGDKNSANIAKATGDFREQGLSDAIIAGQADRNTVAGAQAAAGGKELFNRDSTGSVLDQFTGALETGNPLAQSTINLRNQQAKAAAAKPAAGPKAPAGYRYAEVVGEDGEMRLEPIPGGPKDPNAQTSKPMPASAAKGYLDNLQNLARAEKALALVSGQDVGEAKGDKNATGAKGILPMQILNRVDPSGAETRAALADLGSLVIHDRSGAAVTAAEFPRLAPFIPTVYDDAATSQKKLRLFVQNYKAIVEDAAEFYKASGYNVPAMSLAPSAPVKPAPAGGGWSIQKE